MIKLLGILTGVALFALLYSSWLNPEQAKTWIDGGGKALTQGVDQVTKIKQEVEQHPVYQQALEKVEQTQHTLTQPLTVDPIQPLIELPPLEMKHHVFWQPFSNAAAAQGFAERLRMQTGLPLSSAENGKGDYVVMLEYSSKDQLQQALRKLRSIIGRVEAVQDEVL